MVQGMMEQGLQHLCNTCANGEQDAWHRLTPSAHRHELSPELYQDFTPKENYWLSPGERACQQTNMTIIKEQGANSETENIWQFKCIPTELLH